ncbi:MAG: glycosyltransferase [Sphingobacteriaceae bacterium]|nr:glycosyltransferase [Sphingobacteriaceae bacterium]
MKIVHIIVCLDKGGAEKILFDLVTKTQSIQVENIIISLTSIGYYGQMLQERGVTVIPLNLKKNHILSLFMLRNVMKRYKPDLICSWLYHANFISIFCRLLGYKNIVWNIHNTYLPWKTSSKVTFFLNRICSKLSFIPKRIIYCADKAKKVHVELGYNLNRSVVIYNGYDLGHYLMNNEWRNKIRMELNISQHELVIGHVARYNSAKDHKNFIQALKIVFERCNTLCLKVIMVGNDIDEQNIELINILKENQLLDRVMLLGIRSDVNFLYNAMDVFVLSSSEEAFPNVIAEAMASGVPCVVTEAGDAGNIIGDCGILVPIKNSLELANGMITMLNFSPEKRAGLSYDSRMRITNLFDIDKMIHNYLRIYTEILHD